MNKREFAVAISNKNGISQREAMERLDQVVEIIMDQLEKHQEIKIRDFGTFKTVRREARVMINPKTQEKMNIPERYVPMFIPGKTLKESVRGGKD